MQRVQGFIAKQCHGLLNNYRYAVLCAVILSFIPYVTWLSGVVVALITLRRGARDGAMLLAPVIALHFAGSSIFLTTHMALSNTLLTFIPGYIAAVTLYATASWRAVSGVLFISVLLTMLLLHLFLPDLIQNQWLYLQSMANQSDHGSAVFTLMQNVDNQHQSMLSNYLIGIQAMTIVVYNLLGVVMARDLQAKLFNPGGFKQEILSLQLDKTDCFISLLISSLSFMAYSLAINVLPVVFIFMMCAGASCMASWLERKRLKYYGFLVMIPLVALPVVVGPVYVFVGLVDGIFDLRHKK